MTLRADIRGSLLRETTIAAPVVADMLQYLEQKGFPQAAIARECGIDLSALATPDHRVPGRQVERLWEIAEAKTGDSLIGMHMAEGYSPGALDILGYVILSCRTIGEALDRLSRYARLLNDGLRVEIVRDGASAYCRCSVIDSMDNYLLRAPEQAIDTIWVGLAREMGRLTAMPLAPTEVWFRRKAPSPSELKEYQRIFGPNVKFSAREDRFIFPAAHLDELLRSANPGLLRAFEQHADDVLAAMEKQGSRSHQVAQVLAVKLKGAVPPLRDIAREMAMSDRNLQRALRNDGTSYQKVLDEVRRDLAIRYLANPSTSMGQIGFLLGFSEPSAFHRAFRRWTGKAPSAYRSEGSGAGVLQ